MATLRIFGLLVMLILTKQASGWFCYDHNPGDKWSVVPCFSGSCFSIGAKVLGFGDAKKGCADKVYPNVCQAANFNGLASEHVCFCNSILCNSSTNVAPSLLLPLLMLGYFLWM
ncbi:uncharacterized protein LOC122264880 [Penaeus japonicus]|uniref:uncharacterized protein LOC122264880 n=1 Tax=Penaeus japonicus TaxID=27405 RepID=UPI001C71748A|nr:uncharacterized protein LOC122264880 [Penaeus japonicus]